MDHVSELFPSTCPTQYLTKTEKLKERAKTPKQGEQGEVPRPFQFISVKGPNQYNAYRVTIFQT